MNEDSKLYITAGLCRGRQRLCSTRNEDWNVKDTDLFKNCPKIVVEKILKAPR
jgi:hypothetical protein